jgi:hypothetical protein
MTHTHFVRLSALALLAAAGIAATPAPQPSATMPAPVTPTAKIELFNGKDLDGWTPVVAKKSVPADKLFSVKDGLIRIESDSNGYLRSNTSYTNYKATMEWKFVDLKQSGNTGLLVHINTPDKVWPKCIEVQGRHDHLGEFWIWGGAKVAEKLVQRNGVMPPKPPTEKPVGEWNTLTAVCKGDKVTILVNGEESNSVTGCNITSGYVALQAEGCVMDVRRLTIEPLD